MKNCIMILAALVAFNCHTAETKKNSADDIKAKREAFYRKTGGLVRKPNTGSGKVVFINAQKRVSDEGLKELAKKIETEYRIKVEVRSGTYNGLSTADAEIKKCGAAAGVVVVDAGEAIPPLVVLPDMRCSVVNVSAFPEGAYDTLLRKQAFRGLAAASGAMSSQVPITLMSAFDNLKKLSIFPHEVIPADVGVRMRNTLRGYGVAPFHLTTYRQACREGWAATPKNDIEKAIWDEVRQLPTKPIKIKFDPVKGK